MQNNVIQNIFAKDLKPGDLIMGYHYPESPERVYKHKYDSCKHDVCDKMLTIYFVSKYFDDTVTTTIKVIEETESSILLVNDTVCVCVIKHEE